jgi:ketosteroid isomerase-like protein
MNKTSTFLLFSFLLASAVQPGLADDGTLRPILEGRYAAMKSAMANCDAEAISSLLTPDFVSIDVSGDSENAARMITEVNALPKDPSKISNTEILSVDREGEVAVVQQRYDMKITKSGPDDSKGNIELIAISTDTWINPDGVWLLQKTETNQIDLFVDGKPISHEVRSKTL